MVRPLVKLAWWFERNLVAEVKAARAGFRNLIDLPAAPLVRVALSLPASMYRERRRHHGG